MSAMAAGYRQMPKGLIQGVREVDGQLAVLFEPSELAKLPSVQRELAKRVVVDRTFVEGLGQMLVRGEAEYRDADTWQPWYTIWTGRGDWYERLRVLFVRWAPRVVAKLVADLTRERDELYTKCDQITDNLSARGLSVRRCRGCDQWLVVSNVERVHCYHCREDVPA